MQDNDFVHNTTQPIEPELLNLTNDAKFVLIVITYCDECYIIAFITNQLTK